MPRRGAARVATSPAFARTIQEETGVHSGPRPQSTPGSFLGALRATLGFGTQSLRDWGTRVASLGMTPGSPVPNKLRPGGRRRARWVSGDPSQPAPGRIAARSPSTRFVDFPGPVAVGAQCVAARRTSAHAVGFRRPVAAGAGIHNAEGVAIQSPGLHPKGTTPGERAKKRYNPERVATWQDQHDLVCGPTPAGGSSGY